MMSVKMYKAFCAGVAALLTVTSTAAAAFDGWHLESETVIPGAGVVWDYTAFDQSTNRLFIGHRQEGLQVFDVATRKLVKTVDKTASHSANGPVLMPEFDLGISSNQDGTITPFKLSTLEAREPVKVGQKLDNSFYDPATKRIFVNMESDAEGTALVVLQAPGLEKIGEVRIKSKGPEFAEGDGAGNYYLASRDLSIIYKIDARELKVTAEWSAAVGGCGGSNNLALDVANKRIFLGCRGDAKQQLKPSFAVMDMDTGKVIHNEQIGGGVDGLIYDADLKRIFVTSGLSGTLHVFEPVNADTYKKIEALGTSVYARNLVMNFKTKKLYSVTAESTADYSKTVSALAPWYPNTVFPNTFRVLEYSK